MSQEQEHPLKKYSEKEKVAYLSIVATLVSADGEVSDKEIANIRALCKAVDLSAEGIGKIIAVAENPNTAPINQYINDLKSSELRFTLLTDMWFLAYADEKLETSEINHINEIGSKLNVSQEQIAALKKYVDAVIKASKAGEGANMKDLGGDVAATLAATGIPLGAVAVSGTVFGLSAAGITSGLAALGLGFGMATGIGAVAVIGVGSYFAVKWLWKKIF